ncbi:protein of unknown function [Pseudorhizobium banfieldiae]|uniref:Uncharacterized protein n=1 Tax=Pseudorhizobium banfieldiae TaxID=1125847 RepID=L0ND91_9HYPH|nr:hypothetical protein [Pseudorhizobium banfieldiae]CAD6605854.1 hypothetical protein RNT25_01737 [arsenite-oxidising bacterium NT-25]CCF19083.1 protein of unknown function [Pseudorhizobium banfieldiae]
MGAITNQDRAAIRKIFRKTKEETDRIIRQRGQPSVEQMPNIIASQNALRSCIEVIINECAPVDELYFGELAIRMASYFVSGVPVERQVDLLTAVIEGLPPAHARRLREGVVIKTGWVTDGVNHPNIPAESDIQ